MKKITIYLNQNYDTEKFTRFDEDAEKDDKKLGSLYIKQFTMEELGNPNRIKVTIETDE